MSDVKPIPEGYPQISPYLAVDGAAAFEMLAPPGDRMVARPANPRVNSGRHEGPQLSRGSRGLVDD